MLGLLPWEKLHPALLGPLLIFTGVYLSFNSPAYSWHQIEGGLSALAGVFAFVHGVRKLINSMRNFSDESMRAGAARRLAIEMAQPDYANYSEEKLRQVLGRIDKARFPERVAEIEARLRAFEGSRKVLGV